jgi:hypothetical protein
VPILVIDSRDLVDCSEKVKIYIHSANKMDMKKYKLIGVDSDACVIREAPQVKAEHAMAYYLKEIQKNTSKNVVVLHSQKLDPEILAQVFVSYLKDEFRIPPSYAKQYLARSLPKANFHLETEEQEVTKPVASVREVAGSKATVEFKDLFLKLQDQAGSEKTSRAYNLLNTLTTNIYSHQDESMYRKVRRTTKQVSELSKHSAFLALLEKLGWEGEQEFWVNKVESKYLKIFKTDLDVGFKQFQSKQTS